MKKGNEITKVITGSKVQLIASAIGTIASELGLVMEYFDDKEYFLFIFLLITNLLFLVGTFTTGNADKK